MPAAAAAAASPSTIATGLSRARISHPVCGRPERHEYADAEAGAIAVARYQVRGNKGGGHLGAESDAEAAAGSEVVRVAPLELPHRKHVIRFLDMKVVRRLFGDFQASVPEMTILETETAFEHDRVRRLSALLVASPTQRSRPDAAGAQLTMVCGRCGDAIDVDARRRAMGRFCLGEMTGGDLQHESRRRRDREPAGERIEDREVEVPPVLVRLAAVEYRRLRLPTRREDAGRDDAVGDVRRVEPVVSRRRQ